MKQDEKGLGTFLDVYLLPRCSVCSRTAASGGIGAHLTPRQVCKDFPNR